MNFHVVTTTNAAGWEETGRRMAQSFVERWTRDARLTVYAEGFDPFVAGVAVRSLPAWLDAFKARHRDNPAANGLRNGRYTYTHDAVKFAHKVAALTDFAESITDGIVIWLDADTYTHADVSTKWLESLFPETSYLAWLDRRNAHPECGFVMYRASHPHHRAFMAAYRDLYASGGLFKLPQTEDCTALAHIVGIKVANRLIPPAHSLSGRANRCSHVFANSELGSRMDHLKGPRKQEGRSRRADLVLPRNEDYWRA